MVACGDDMGALLSTGLMHRFNRAVLRAVNMICQPRMHDDEKSISSVVESPHPYEYVTI